MRRSAFLFGLVAAGCLLPPLEWREAGYFHASFDDTYAASRQALEAMGFRIEKENKEEGDLETHLLVRRALSAGAGSREYVRVKVRPAPGGFSRVQVIAVAQRNENPGGPTSNPELAHWGLEENGNLTESEFIMRLQRKLGGSSLQ
jgi:hypothetical protein